jgi:hypothetical protein
VSSIAGVDAINNLMQPARNLNMTPGSSSPQPEILEIIKIIIILLFLFIRMLEITL